MSVRDERDKGEVNSPSSEGGTLSFFFSALGHHRFKCSGLRSGLSHAAGSPGWPFFEFRLNYTTGFHVLWLPGDMWNIVTPIIS